MNDRDKRLLIEAAAKAEHDEDEKQTGNREAWDDEPDIVKAIYRDRATRWFRPVLSNFDELSRDGWRSDP